jgi:hypothetical protein
MERSERRLAGLTKLFYDRRARCPDARRYMDATMRGWSPIHVQVQALAGAAVICGFPDNWVREFVSTFLSATTGYKHRVHYDAPSGAIRIWCDLAANGITRARYRKAAETLTVYAQPPHPEAASAPAGHERCHGVAGIDWQNPVLAAGHGLVGVDLRTPQGVAVLSCMAMENAGVPRARIDEFYLGCVGKTRGKIEALSHATMREMGIG